MMRDAEAFDAIVFFDIDRFGRDGRRSMEALYTLTDLNVSIWDFSTGQELDLDSFEGETMTFMKTRFAQQYRDQVRKHTRDSHRRKAEQGFVTGGRVFGYDNHRQAKGETIRDIKEVEAAVVRDIFSRYAAGDGAFTIAAALNRVGAPSPRAQQGRPNGWSVSTIREVLKPPLYRGEIVYGKTKSASRRELRRLGRTCEKAQIPTPEETWIRLPVNESLLIVDAEVTARVDARRTDRRARYRWRSQTTSCSTWWRATFSAPSSSKNCWRSWTRASPTTSPGSRRTETACAVKSRTSWAPSPPVCPPTPSLRASVSGSW
jgi:DNA invertase Pin-like site-specific DNA recombinase